MSWSQHKTEIAGRPAQVLIDDRFCSLAPVAELPRLAWFGIHCSQDSGGGFWPQEETSKLDSIEKDLIRLCGQFGHGWTVYVMRIDTQGLREYFFYAGGSAALAEVGPSLRAAYPAYRIEFKETTDPDWNRYTQLLKHYRPVA